MPDRLRGQEDLAEIHSWNEWARRVNPFLNRSGVRRSFRAGFMCGLAYQKSFQKGKEATGGTGKQG